MSDQASHSASAAHSGRWSFSFQWRGRWISGGRRRVTRGDGVEWYKWGLWFKGAGSTAAIGSTREFHLEYDPGTRGSVTR